MKRLDVLQPTKIGSIIESIVDSTYNRVVFFHNLKKDNEQSSRFFAPLYKIFDSTNVSSLNYDQDYEYRVTRALLDVMTVDLDYTIASYINSIGAYVVHVGVTFDSCIMCAKHSKQHKQINSVDLRTGKVFTTNG